MRVKLPRMDLASRRPIDVAPSDAAPVSAGTYYFLAAPSLGVGAAIPESTWCLPWKKRKSAVEGRHDLPEAWAHSVFLREEYLQQGRQFSAWARKKSIAAISLGPVCGVAKESESDLAEGHLDWWCNDVDHDHGGNVVREGGASA